MRWRAAAQETKWFWNLCVEYWWLYVDTFGRCLPVGGDARRVEGVGTIMDCHMTDTRRDAGEQWCTVSSCVVSARFHLAKDGDEERKGESGRRF